MRRRCNRERPARRRHHGRQRPMGAGARAAAAARATWSVSRRCGERSRPRRRSASRRCRPMRSRPTTGSAHGLKSDGLFGLFRSYLERELAALVDAGVRLTVIGRRDRLDGSLVRAIERGRGRDHLVSAAPLSPGHRLLGARRDRAGGPRQRPRRPDHARARRASASAAATDSLANVPDVDLLIRTGGEQRLSDFLLWECAYAELWFTQTMWPDFDGVQLARAVEEFRTRDRRFGGVAVG